MALLPQVTHTAKYALLVLMCSLFLLLQPASSTVLQEEMMKLKLEQKRRIDLAELQCNHTLANSTKPTDGIYCDAVWDNIMCWPYTPAGTVASNSCPAIIAYFTPLGQATRICEENGTWRLPPKDANRNQSGYDERKGWTNFSACLMQPTTPKMPRSVPGIIKEHMPVISQIAKVGYSISLVSLVVATTIMLKLKRLYCRRNVIHINLFVTFMLRSVICLMRYSLLVQDLGLEKDVQYDQDGKIEFNPIGPHWECKLLLTMFQWALCSNYMWIFVEGLYLHTLVFFAVFDQKVIFKWYIIIGWVTPFFFVIPWVMIRIFLNDTLCWNTHEHGYFWILNGPIILSICMNFFFFLNIMRVLFVKLRASTTGHAQRYRKFAKSTLVLIPLFGVYYIFFVIMNNQSHGDPGLEVAVLYAEMTLNSFQGMVVAILFCFTNGEVRSELLKLWRRQMLRRQSVVSLRSSRAMSTTSFLFKERASISGPPWKGPRFPNALSSISLGTSAESSLISKDRLASRLPATGSSPNLRIAPETNGGLEGRALKVQRRSPSCSRTPSDAANGTCGGSEIKANVRVRINIEQEHGVPDDSSGI